MQQDSSIKAIHDLARRSKIFVEYRLDKESGPAHAKMYTVRLHLGDKDYVGTERSIKLAQRAAAQSALNDHDISQINIQSPTIALNAWASRNHIPIQYVLRKEQFLSTSPNRSHILFYYRVYLGHDLYFDGHGPTHQQARVNCALNAFYFLRQNQLSPPSTPQLNFSSCSSPISKSKHSTKSEISLMYERAKQLGLSVHIEFLDRFTVTYHIGGQYSATGKGFNKHSAKQAAAEKMLKILPTTDLQSTINPITRIYQFAQARQVKIEFIPISNKDTYIFQIKFGDNTIVEGQGKTKQMAKRAAAEILLDKLDPIVVLPPPPAKGLLKRDGNKENITKQEKKHVHFVEEVIKKDEQLSSRQSPPSPSSSNMSCSNKQQLIEACQKFQIHLEYLDEMIKNENSNSSRYQSIVSLSTSNRLLAQFRGYGPTLLRAQENASSAAWNNLRQLFNESIQASCKSKKQEKNNQQISIQLQ
ncbi:unnamed protein product [Adineta steineri]|uniref:DRBM domain-containing protein n=2 Tax=Adineta steineri TaxID=433720 RepID=A0A813WG47_9BILA|nr:unnamed protein product [Adineta steineri]